MLGAWDFCRCPRRFAMPRAKRGELQPVGELLVSYSADQLPTDAIEHLFKQTLGEHFEDQRSTKDTLRVFEWLLRIAIQKLRAHEVHA